MNYTSHKDKMLCFLNENLESSHNKKIPILLNRLLLHKKLILIMGDLTK